MKKMNLFLLQTLIVTGLFFAVGCNDDETDQLPTCSITVQASSTEFAPTATIPIVVTAQNSDNVQLFVDNVAYSTKTEAPYNFTVSARELSLGQHTLKAVATNNSGVTGESAVVPIIVSNHSPICSITAPANNAEVAGSTTISVEVTASDIDGIITEVQLFIDNVAYSNKILPPYNFTIPAGTLRTGSHTLRAVAKDNRNTTAVSTIAVIVPNVAPTCVITSPANNAAIDFTESFSVSVTAQDADGIANVQLFIDGTLRDTKTATPYTYTVNAGLSVGAHILRAVATDNLGLTGQSTITINIVKIEPGTFYQGGIIAYVDATGKHGLIAAPSDQSSGIRWRGCDCDEEMGADGLTIGTGQTNTNTIVNRYGNGNGNQNYAAKLCKDLNLNGYNDWFLPSRDELLELYKNRSLIGGFTTTGDDNNTRYWSSSQDPGWKSVTAICVRFGSGSVTNHHKMETLKVRAVRKF